MKFNFETISQVNSFITSFTNALEEAYCFENVRKIETKLNKDGSMVICWKISNQYGLNLVVVRIYADFSGVVEFRCGSEKLKEFNSPTEMREFIDGENGKKPLIGFMKLQMERIYVVLKDWMS